jgi:hypothetical protein
LAVHAAHKQMPAFCTTEGRSEQQKDKLKVWLNEKIVVE